MKLSNLEEAATNIQHTTAFTQIKELGKAQQIKVNMKLLKGVLKVVEALEKLDYEEIYLTVEKDSPLVIGGKSCGIALATMTEESE